MIPSASGILNSVAHPSTAFPLPQSLAEPLLSISELGLFAFAGIVVAGLIGEHISEKQRDKWIPTSTRPPSWNWPAIWLWVVVAGVLGEFFCDAGVWDASDSLQAISDRATTELQKQADSARQQTAQLQRDNLTLQRQVADAQGDAARAAKLAAQVQQAANWRIMPSEQRTRLGAALSEGVGGAVVLAYEAGDPECIFLTWQILAAFDSANQEAGKRLWQIETSPRVHSRAIYWNIKIFGKMDGIVNSLQGAFRASALQFGADSVPAVINDSPGIVIGGEPAPQAEIWIGPKMPPNFSP